MQAWEVSQHYKGGSWLDTSSPYRSLDGLSTTRQSLEVARSIDAL